MATTTYIYTHIFYIILVLGDRIGCYTFISTISLDSLFGIRAYFSCTFLLDHQFRLFYFSFN